jgi:hypothetical protein
LWIMISGLTVLFSPLICICLKSTPPVEFDIYKKPLVTPEHGKEGYLKMVGQPVIDADLVQLAGIIGSVLLNRTVEQGAVFLG